MASKDKQPPRRGTKTERGQATRAKPIRQKMEERRNKYIKETKKEQSPEMAKALIKYRRTGSVKSKGKIAKHHKETFGSLFK